MNKKSMTFKDQAILFGLSDPKTIARFKSKLRPMPNGCIEFESAAWDSRDLYRVLNITIQFKGSNAYSHKVKPHRFAFALANGFDALPKSHKRFDMDSGIINHICHNKACVNPKHLNILTGRENLQKENQQTK